MRSVLTCLWLLSPVPVILAGQRPDTLTARAVRPVTLAWRHSPEDLSGPARPAGYVSVIGRRSALLGSETGTFEAWTWPLKLLHGFELAFKTPLYDRPIAAKDIARRVEITPGGVTIVYGHPAFAVTERLFAPLAPRAGGAGLAGRPAGPRETVAQ